MLLEREQDLEQLRYPIGRFQARAGLSSAERAALIGDIAGLPAALRAAELDDAKCEDIEVSLALLESLHRRWTRFLRSLRDEQFERAFIHPDLGRVTLGEGLQHYAWHGRHHLAHITRLREGMGW